MWVGLGLEVGGACERCGRGNDTVRPITLLIQNQGYDSFFLLSDRKLREYCNRIHRANDYFHVFLRFHDP